MQILFLFILCSCANSQTLQRDSNTCPYISLSSQNSYLTQIVNYSSNFRVEFIGYEVYCYYFSPAQMRFAEITPSFRVVRLKPSDDTEVDFSFYTDTTQGPPEFLGKRNYFVSVKNIGDKKIIKAQPVKVRIPLINNEFQIELGLNMSPAEKNYNAKNPYVHFGTISDYKPVSSCSTKDQKPSCGCGI